MVKIPLSLPASMLPTPAPASAPASSDPASSIEAAGAQIIEAYKAYDKLRALTSQLNGLRDSDPIPPHVKIHRLAISFEVNGTEHTAALRSVKRVGDLAALLSQETERLIAVMRDSAVKARESAGVIEALCSRSQYVANAQRGAAP